MVQIYENELNLVKVSTFICAILMQLSDDVFEANNTKVVTPASGKICVKS